MWQYQGSDCRANEIFRICASGQRESGSHLQGGFNLYTVAQPSLLRGIMRTGVITTEYLLIDKAAAGEHNSARGFGHIPFYSLPGTQSSYILFTKAFGPSWNFKECHP